jgi:hypothetical protein
MMLLSAYGLDWFRKLVLDEVIIEVTFGRLSESFHCAEKHKIKFFERKSSCKSGTR